MASYRDNKRAKVTDAIVATAREMLTHHDRQVVVAYIERESGCCHRTAAKVLEDLAGPMKREVMPKSERMTIIRQRARLGVLPKQIASELGVSEECIRRNAREAGIRFQSGRREAVK